MLRDDLDFGPLCFPSRMERALSLAGGAVSEANNFSAPKMGVVGGWIYLSGLLYDLP